MAHRPLALIVALAGLVGSALAPARVGASTAAPPRGGTLSCAASVPAPAICDHTLGLALTIPAGWSVAPRGKFPPGVLAFWTLVPGSQEPPQDLVVEAVGLATSCSDAQAATAVADALDETTHTTFPRPRRLHDVAGAPAVFLSGVPSPEPSVQIVVAHHGAVYQLIFPGNAHGLKPDQRQALASLRFIPRSGPFPSRRDPFITPALRACATVHTEQLTLEDAMDVSPLTFFVDGSGFPPDRPVTVRLTWRGTPFAGMRPRYTSYTAYRMLRSNSQGAFVAPLSVPVNGVSFRSFTTRIVAAGARGTWLAATHSVFRQTSGTIIPTQTIRSCGSAS